MKGGPEAFAKFVPAIVAQVTAGDVAAAATVRAAVATLAHWDLPIGIRHEGALVGALHRKLESPNRYRSHWSLLNAARAQWEREIWVLICRTLQVASVAGLKALGRAPACEAPMAIQVVRLVKSVREFIRDDDNLPFSAKSLHDALKRVQLIKDDRRAWLTMAPIVQDVSPIGVPVTVFILRPLPVAAVTLKEPAHVRVPRPRQIPPCPDQAGNDRHGDDAPRVRRPRGHRAIDV